MRIDLKIDDALEENLKLWRYMDLAKLISLLGTNAIWLARADTLRDKQEGCFPDEMRVLIEKAYESLSNGGPARVKDADDFQDYLLKNTFVSCWHKNTDENMVMWEVYGRDTYAVAVQTTVGRIKNNIDVSKLGGHSLLLKSVAYKKFEDVKEVLPYEECFFIKRPHFEFEKEVRISLDTYSRINPVKRTPSGYDLPVAINNLIENIYVHPDSSEWFFEVVKSIAKRYEVDVDVKRGACGNN